MKIQVPFQIQPGIYSNYFIEVIGNEEACFQRHAPYGETAFGASGGGFDQLGKDAG